MSKKKFYISNALVVMLLMSVVMNTATIGAIKTSVATGTWATAGTWNPSGVPANTDTVVITGYTVTVDANATCGAINIVSGGTLTINSTFVLTVSGGGTSPVTYGTVGGAGALNGGTVGSVTGIVTTGDWIYTGTITNRISVTLNGTGDQTYNGSINLRSFTINKASGTAYITTTPTITGGTLTLTNGNINYNGVSQNVLNANHPDNLNLSGSGTKTWTLTAGRTVGGNLAVGTGTNLTTAGNQTLGVTGTTTVDGTLTLGGTSAKTFTGAVTINSDGVWNETGTSAYAFANGLTHNGTTFTANTGVHTFQTNAQAIGGSSAISIPSVTVTGITLTNNGTLTVNTALAGNGTLLNSATLNLGGTCSVTTLTNNGTVTSSGNGTTTSTTVTNNGTFNIGSTGAVTAFTNAATGILNFTNTTVPTITTLTVTATGNTVNYTAAGDQAIRDVNYYNLATSGSGTKTWTLTAGRTVGGNLAVGTGTNLTTAGNQTLGVTGTTTVDGTLTLGGTSAKTFTGAVTINNGGVWNETGNSAYAFANGLTHNGTTFTANTGVHTFQTNAQAIGGSSAISIPSVTVTGITLTNNGTLTVNTALAGNGTLLNSATLNLGGTCSVTTLTNNGTVTSSGNGTTTSTTVTNNGTFNIGSTGAVTAFTNAATGILNFTNTTVPTITTLTVTATGNTVNYTAAGDQAIRDVNYYNLATSGSGTKTWTLGGGRTVGGNLAVGAGTGLTTANNQTLGITGTTTVDGTLTLGGTSAKTFTGAVTINNGASITESAAAALVFSSDVTINSGGTLAENGNAVVSVAGNFTNDGTYTASTGVHTFSGTTKTLGGTSPINIPSVTVSGSYTNNGTLTITTALAGAGGLTNGTNATLNINFTGVVGITTLTATASGNTVNYGFAGDQTIRAITYSNLTISVSGTKTLANAISVTNNLAIENAAILACDSYSITGNATGTFMMASGTGLRLGNTGSATAPLFPTNYTAANITLNPTSTVTYQTNTAKTISTVPTYGNLTITTGATASAATVTGTLNISGNLTITNGGGAASLDFGSSVTTINVLGDLSGNGTINMTGASLAHVLNLAGTNNAIVTFNTTPNSGSTVNYNHSGDQQVFASANYRNLRISNSGTKTLQGNATVNDELYISTNDNTTNLATGIYTLTGGSGSFGMDYGTAFTLGLTGSATSVPFPTFTGGYLINSGSTVVYQANVAETISSLPAYGNLTITTGATAVTKTIASAITVNGNLTANNGTAALTLSVSNGVTANVAGNFAGNASTVTLVGNSVLDLGGNNTTTGATFNSNSSTVNYNGSHSGQIVRGGITYYNLQISNGGTKLLQAGNAIVSNVLTLSSGVFKLNDYNLQLNNTSASAIVGTFDNTNMIQTNGLGYLQKAGGALGSGLNIIYPVGAGGFYNPLDLSSAFTATGASGTIQISATSVNQGSDALSKYWTLTVSGYTTVTTNLRFKYDNAEAKGARSNYDTYYNSGSSWVLAPGTRTGLGENPFGTNVSGVTPASISGKWSAGATAPGTPSAISYYSYQSGDWSDATSWTTDGSGTLWLNPGIPGSIDNVTILNGRTITINTNSKQVTSLAINQGGILNINSTTGHNFGTVTGQGKLMLSSNTFPGGTYTSFVASSGGTIEYFNLNNVYPTLLTYNNLIISNYSSSANTVYLNNGTNPTTYTINGNFSLKNYSTGSQTFYFGNPTASDNLINMTVHGNFSVDAGCSVRVNNFATSHPISSPSNSTTVYNLHKLYLYGNLTNNGSVRFTGLPSPVVNAYYTLTVTAYNTINYGDVEVYFYGALNNTITCNGTTDFYRLIVEKGVDKTYTLEVNSSNTNNFALYAPNYQGNNIFDGGTDLYGWGVYYKALYLHYGTLKLDENINIPSLTEGGQDFNIIPTAALWVNGANVSTTLTGVNGTGYQAATLYGTLRISAGQFSTGDAAGIVLGTLGTPVIRIEGTGVLDASQAWAAAGTNLMSYIQTGGTANFRMQGEVHAGPMLGLSSTNASFVMSGGTINFTDKAFIGGTTNFNILSIQSQVGNYQVTGGTINLNLQSSDTVYTANSTVPLYNLNVSRRIGTGTVTIQWTAPASNLTVLHDLTVGNNTILDLNANSIDLNVGRNFTIASAGTYIPAKAGASVTTFNGTGEQSLYNMGLIAGGLTNLTFSNTSITSIISNNLIVNGILTIGQNAALNDSGKYIYAYDNIVNSGNHFGWQTNGGIRLVGTTGQVISGSGTGIFHNLILDKPNTSSVTLAADVSISGNLRLVSATNFNIGVNRVTFGPSAHVYTDFATTQSYDSTRMIMTNGLASDRGIGKTYDSLNASFLYPIGAGALYRPAQIQITSVPTQYGSIIIKPVTSPNPLVQAANSAINLYWKVQSSNFSGVQSGSVNHIYYYKASDSPNPSDQTNYIPAVYISPAWNVTNSIDSVLETNPREIHFGNMSSIDGEYTCGLSAAFSGLATYYSNSNYSAVTSLTGANWDDPNTWCVDSCAGTPVGSVLPDNMSNAVFIIGDGSATVHRINIPSGHSIQTGNILIKSDGVLDIGATTGHNFGSIPNTKVTGSGKLRIASSAYFPTGDWGDFLGSSGGTVEYYTTTSGTLQMPSSYNLPVGGSVAITSYYDLVTLPYSGSNIILPNTNLTVFNNFKVAYTTGGGTANCITQINAGANSRTLQVFGNLTVEQYGILQYMNNAAQYVLVDKDITIAEGGALRVGTGGTGTFANTLTVHGDIINDGTLDLNPDYPSNTRYSNTIFNGLLSKSVYNTTTPTLTRFYGITVNKGSNRDSVVDIRISPTNFYMGSGGLTMQNGTFRLSTNVTMPLSTGAFTIPISGCLSANGGTFNIATSTAASADLNLIGRLEVLSGTVNVGPATSSYAYNIVYAAAGTPEITVTGGALNVYSQIRRDTSNTSGSLNYTQTGGIVSVGGRNANTKRSVFELLNIGSKFVMSGGILNIVTHINTSSPYDLYIEPDLQTVTGGTVQLGLNGVTTNGALFTMLASSPLGNLTLDTATNSCAIQEIYDLTLKGNLTVGGATSYYNTNGLDVTIGGNLTNNNTTAASNGLNVGGYRTQVLTQTTTFNGTNDQTISGTSTPNRTNFACVEVLAAVGRSLNLSNITTSNISTSGSLTLTSGTLNDNGNTIYVLNNVDNNAVHYSSDSTKGGMIFCGTTNQGITGSGYGIFGNIEINNGGNGVNITDNSTINGRLKLTNGYLYIDDYLLTLGENAGVVGTFSSTNLILLNGVLSDEGVKKAFPTGTPSFTFPIGANGKYTPCTFNLTQQNNNAGATIKVIPVDALHPSINPANYSNYLNYYWNIVSQGFASNYRIAHSYTFKPEDTTGHPANIERCDNVTSGWSDLNGTITSTSFSFDTTFLDGGYTIGDKFASLPILYSNKSGSWNDSTVWSLDSIVYSHTPVPNGNPVVIRLSDSVALSTNGSYAASVLVKGVLDAMNTTFHNLGVVSGTGKIRLRGTNDGLFIFPGGTYDAFFTNIGSTIEFYGNTNSTLPSDIGDQYKPYQNVLLSGTGIKSFSSINLKINGNLTFAPGSKLDNSSYNKDIFILGNWIDQNTTTAGFTPGTGTVRFTSAALQRIVMANNSMKETFYNVAINNIAGVIIQTGSIDVSNQLILTSGNITTSSNNNLTITNTNTNAVVGGSINSFVNGPLKKRISNGSSFQFPVGDTISLGRKRFGYVTVSNTITSGTQVWTAKFVDKDPSADGYNVSAVTAPLNSVVSNEYWNIIGPTGGAANVTLSWDQYTGMSNLASERAQANVAEWNTPVASSWNSVGQTVMDFRKDSGTVATSTQVSLEDRIFTIGATGLKALIAATASGLWSNTAIWSNGRVPGQNDTVVINNSITITLNTASSIAKLIVNTGGTFNDSTYALTIGGDIVLNGSWRGSGKIIWATTNDTLYGSGTMTGASTLELSGSGKVIASSAAPTLTNVSILATDTLYNNGSVTIVTLTGGDASAAFVNHSGATLTISGVMLSTGSLIADQCPNTIIYNGIIAQSIKPATYCDLILNNGGVKTAGQNFEILNNFTIGFGSIFTINNGIAVQVRGVATTAGTINNNGHLNISD